MWRAFVARGFIPVGARSGPKKSRLPRSPTGINPLATKASTDRGLPPSVIPSSNATVLGYLWHMMPAPRAGRSKHAAQTQDRRPRHFAAGVGHCRHLRPGDFPQSPTG
ncbi:hypothetical protein DM828_13775 [Pseudomonas umsongensis]|nr:hypothetical protein [Pseudomonas umsongensis]